MNVRKSIESCLQDVRDVSASDVEIEEVKFTVVNSMSGDGEVDRIEITVARKRDGK